MPRSKSTKSKGQKIQKESTIKTIKLPISKLIDTKFREYALYVLSNRGIPSFYDGLTPVQRYILSNSPQSFTKTLSVVGDSIKDGYHHGDMSLGKAIAKLARPFGCSLQLLEGYGFFGSEVSPEPASARYTSIKIAPKASEILRKYKYLFTKDNDGAHSPFWVDFPLGLTTGIIGIAVGYKTTILPRKLEDVKEYFEGKRKSVKPYFKDFSGSIQRYKGLEKAWIISSSINVVGNKIEIRELPPIMKFTSALKRLDWLFNKFEGKIKVLDNSNTKANIDVIYYGKSAEEWKQIQEFVQKTFSIIVTETPVFIKDNQVLVYDRIEEYLDDFKWQLLRLDFHDKEYQRNWNSAELDFNRAKKLFIAFILQTRRTVAEIDVFLKPYSDEIKSRLENMTSKRFTKDELEKTAERIKELEIALRSAEKALKESQKLYESTPDPTKSRGISSKKMTTDLFDSEDVSEVDGITVWDGEDPYEDTKQPEELDE
jgi:topoisomerase-4 subunit A